MNTREYKHTNSLMNESSPYLLQHAHNPVNWYPWGPEALEKAKKENKMIIVSIGYAACHWCHVMEHESFEDEEVANYMNEHFVAIKVDREERPDIDQVYMNAVQLLSGRGGWPLNCLALPDGRPVYGGTYFQKEQWLDMLSQVSGFVLNNPDKAEEQAKSLTDGVQNNEMIYANAKVQEFSLDDLDNIFAKWRNDIDFVEGGSLGAPKFPLPTGYQFLLHYYSLTKNEDALKAVTLTLEKMANGGIYDQVGGGFSRYSTDAVWKVPHFEKMLYDNAQLVSLYTAAYQQTKNPLFKTIVFETLEFVQRELTSLKGGFYASLDADSEGVEGKFYCWKKNELKEIIGNHADLIIDYYNVSGSGNWEHDRNILYKKDSDKEFARKYNLTEVELSDRILEAKRILLNERSKRIWPALDDKILTSWNGLMLKAFIDAYRVFDDPDYLKMALKNAEFILTEMKSEDNRLSRNYKNGKATINAFLDDYAFTIQAFIALYQATFDEKWLKEAQQLCYYSIEHFLDGDSGMFYYTSDLDPALIARKMELSDNVIPSSNSEMAKNLFILGQYLYNEDYIGMAKKMLANIKQHALENGIYYANWDILMAWFAKDPYEVAIVGEDCEAKRKEFDSHYLPHVFFYGGKTDKDSTLLEGKLIEGNTTLYVCRNGACQRPVNEVNDALVQIK
ncbi:MAG: thioredoxin domain-containing protein [Paludibacter sp.]|nr:thioredoxin domain-containing protein [Paludibacter sp.]